jgi:Protein of unknown function (DUF2874).
MLILGFIAIMTTSCDKTEIITPTSVDSKVAAFVSTYFPNSNIASAMTEGGEYDITLTDGTQIDFDRKEKWEEIDCQYSTIYIQVPETLIPAEIQTYVETNYPSNYIIKISKDWNRWEIELNNQIDIEFNSSFKVVEID